MGRGWQQAMDGGERRAQDGEQATEDIAELHVSGGSAARARLDGAYASTSTCRRSHLVQRAALALLQWGQLGWAGFPHPFSVREGYAVRHGRQREGTTAAGLVPEAKVTKCAALLPAPYAAAGRVQRVA
jgi:hypothetical protein